MNSSRIVLIPDSWSEACIGGSMSSAGWFSGLVPQGLLGGISVNVSPAVNPVVIAAPLLRSSAYSFNFVGNSGSTTLANGSSIGIGPVSFS